MFGLKLDKYDRLELWIAVAMQNFQVCSTLKTQQVMC